MCTPYIRLHLIAFEEHVYTSYLWEIHGQAQNCLRLRHFLRLNKYIKINVAAPSSSGKSIFPLADILLLSAGDVLIIWLVFFTEKCFFWLVSGASSPETMLTECLQQINSPTFSQPDSPLPLLCQKFASIKPLLSHILCSPATSAPVERVFSQSGLLMRPNRAYMSNSLLETRVFEVQQWWNSCLTAQYRPFSATSY